MWKNTAKLLNNPDVYLEFTRRGANPDSSSPDLTISGDPGDIRTTVLSYSPHSGKLTFRSDFRSSTANGGKPQSIRSISELATATARVKSWFPFSSWGINSVDCIRQVTLGVQGSTLTLTNFHALDYRDDTWAEAGITLYSTNIASTRFVR
jgi:hypothetical protein